MEKIYENQNRLIKIISLGFDRSDKQLLRKNNIS